MVDGVGSPLRHHLYEKYLLGRGIWIKASCVVAAKWQPHVTEIPKGESVSMSWLWLG